MPRNVSGTYTLPLPPVVPNTTIESDWANDTLADISQALTDSLDRYGRGGLTAPFRLIDGTAPQPAWAFNSETGTGMYKAAPGQLGVSIQGTAVGGWTSDGYSGLFNQIDGDLTFTGIPTFDEGVLAHNSMAVVVPTGFPTVSVKVEDAPLDQKITAMASTSPGESYWGRLKDDSSGWVSGIKIGVDDKLYDIFSGRALATVAPSGSSFVPLDGSIPMSGALQINAYGFNIYNAAGPVDKRRAVWSVNPDGTMPIGRLNDASNAWTGGIMVYADNTLHELVTGGLIWNSSNDGQGSGLDADMLRGFVPNYTATPDTLALRDGGASITAAAMRVVQIGGFPSFAMKSSAASPSEDGILYTTGGDGTNRNGTLVIESGTVNVYCNGGQNFAVNGSGGGVHMNNFSSISLNATVWQHGVARDSGISWGWGWARILGGLIVQFHNPILSDDQYLGFTLPIAFPNNLGILVDMVNWGAAATGTSIVSSHGAMVNGTTVGIAISCNFSFNNIPCNYIAMGN